MTRYYGFDYKSTPTTEVVSEQVQGAGCFPEGILVRTMNGYTPIDRLTTNDIVIGYDRYGEIDYGKIEKIHIHDAEYDLYDFGNGFPLVTGNHAIYDYSTNEHKLASDFIVGDAFTTMEGIHVLIDEIKIIPNAVNRVYNLEVVPFHTYFVSTDGEQWFKVHNGGGGKGGSSGGAKEAKDTLRSEAVVNVLEVISEGEIVGIVGGRQGIYINGTPISNSLNSITNPWSHTGILFSIGTTNQLVWTSGTIIKDDIVTYSVVSGNATWTTGTLYAYFNPAVSTTIIQTTTTYATAYGTGCYPIASYTGGAKTNIIGEGTIVLESDNFKNIQTNIQLGTSSQTVIPGYESVASEFSKDVVVTNATPVIQTISGNNISTAVVTISLPNGLFQTNTSTGDTTGYEVEFQISKKKTSDATWTVVHDITSASKLAGKCMSIYERNYSVEAPMVSGVPATSWMVKVTRISTDDSASSKVSQIKFARWSEYQATTEPYNNTAIVSLSVPAKSVGYSIPQRSYLVQGIKVKVPSNYDTILNTYSGSWDGLFVRSWTNNPAWVLYDLLTDTRYGLGKFLGSGVSVNKWAFYDAAVYNDGLVPDGKGGYERRFIFNAVIATQEDAWQLLHAVASNMRANLMISGNYVSLLQDRPQSVVKIINNSNVIDGTFSYSSTDASQHTTSVNVTFNDKNDKYLPRTISITNQMYVDSGNNPTGATVLAPNVNYGNGLRIDPTGTDRSIWGWKVTDVVAYGCVDESYAQRLGKWMLYTEAKQYDMVTFALSLNSIDVGIGDVVKIMDNDWVSTSTSKFLSGRIVSISGTSVVLDSSVILDAGHSYTLSFTNLANDNMIETSVTNTAGTYTTLTLSSAPTAGDYSNKEWILFSTGYIEPRTFKIVSVTELEKARYQYLAIYYDANKWSVVENSTAVQTQTYDRFTNEVLPPVTNITFSEYFSNDGITSKNHILVTFTHTMEIKELVEYDCKWRRDNLTYQSLDSTSLKEFTIPDTTPGVYEVLIGVTNMSGNKSVSAYGTFNYRTAAATSTLEAPSSFYVKGTSGVAFTDEFLSLTWIHNTNNDNKTDRLMDYLLEIWTTDGITKLNQYLIKPDAVNGGSFNYTIGQNKTDYTSASRNVQMKLYSRDLTGQLSTPVIKTFTNAAPAAPSFTLSPGISTTFMNITASTEPDFKGFIVWRSTSGSFTKNDTTKIYDGSDTYTAFEATGTSPYYYAVAAYDSFGKTGLNITSEQNATPLSTSTISWSKTGIDFSIGTTNQLVWTSGTVLKNASTSYSVSAGNATWTTGTLYVYFNPAVSTTVLQTTTTLATAVGTGCYPLATYTGGAATNIKGGDGSAFISGSQVIAGTVGASQLVTGSAVITGSAQISTGIINTAHIIDGNITNAKIANTIQSTNYSPTLFTGWNIDKSGGITTFGSLGIYNTSGNVIFASGNFTWNNVTGTNLPAPNATVGATWGSNIASQPTSLSGINSTEGSKLSGIAAGATVGATWGSNISSQPTSLSGINSTEGSKLSGIADGATKNAIYRQTTAPTGGTYSTNDLWIDTDSVPTTVAQWTGSAWSIVSTYTTNTNQLTDGSNLGGTATWSGVSGTGRPADYATKNTIFRQTTAPTGGTYATGDLWFDTDANPALLYNWDGSAWSIVANNVTNTNQITDGAGLGTTALWSGVTGANRPADNATSNAMYTGAADPTAGLGVTGDSYYNTTTALIWQKVAGTWQKVLPQLTGGVGGNITTFIASAAIGQAQIANLAVGTAQIIDANVETLKIAGNAVTVPSTAYASTKITNTTTYSGTTYSPAMQTLTYTNDLTTDLQVNISFGFALEFIGPTSRYDNYLTVVLEQVISSVSTMQYSAIWAYSGFMVDGGAGHMSYQPSACSATLTLTIPAGATCTYNIKHQKLSGCTLIYSGRFITVVGCKR